jgi:hypothetical protein
LAAALLFAAGLFAAGPLHSHHRKFSWAAFLPLVFAVREPAL